MRINLYSNIHNQAGLERDYLLIRRILEKRNHAVHGVDLNTWKNWPYKADLNIYLEVVDPVMISAAPLNWMIPNSEWWGACWEPCVPRFQKVLCKTKECQRIWEKKTDPSRCIYIGFEANDFMRPEIGRVPEFLHMAGKSETKNTAAVTEAWRKYGLPFKLTVVAFKHEIARLAQGIQNVRHISRLSEDELIQYMNRCLYHVMPSKNEGFGHYIHEALGCGGLVLTTDAPPMNEFEGIAKELLIPVGRKEPRGITTFNIVDAAQIANKVRQAAQLPTGQIAVLRKQAREGFLEGRNYFQKTFSELLTAEGF